MALFGHKAISIRKELKRQTVNSDMFTSVSLNELQDGIVHAVFVLSLDYLSFLCVPVLVTIRTNVMSCKRSYHLVRNSHPKLT